MLQIEVPQTTLWDEKANEFIYVQPQLLSLEHSLVAISKWESKWNIPFIGNDSLSNEAMRDYIRCMTLNEVDPLTYLALTDEHINAIIEYVSAPMSATVITNLEPSTPKKERITSELIYYWMISFGIPMECENWHLSRLLNLIDICNIRNNPPKNMSPSERNKWMRELNASRKKQHNTRG